MLDLLSKIFGPHRAVSIFVFIQNRGVILLTLLGFALGVTALVLMTGPRTHEHLGYLTVPVISTTPVGTQLKNGLIVTVRLPDGVAETITTTEGEIAATVTATACVEQRRYLDTGEFRYRLKLPHNCNPS